jgi:hypothetical protein
VTQISAIPVQSLVGTMPTNDGEQVLIKLARAGGEEFVLAMTPAELLRLFDGGAKSIADATKQSRTPTGLKRPYRVTWFELGSTTTGSVVLSLTFGSGGALSFELPGDMPAQIYETLAVGLGRSELQTPDKSSRN